VGGESDRERGVGRCRQERETEREKQRRKEKDGREEKKRSGIRESAEEIGCEGTTFNVSFNKGEREELIWGGRNLKWVGSSVAAGLWLLV
jgi:hypothetical protein